MKRLRIIKDDKVSFYHLITRVVGGDRMLDNRSLEAFRRGMRAAESFCGVEVLTYCLLSSHMHILIRCPERQAAIASVDDAELVRRYRALYPRPGRFRMSAEVLEQKLRNGGEEGDDLRELLKNRMCDISFFMKLLKQRFSIWYNKANGRFGTLWAERFKSVLVEGGDGAGRGVSGPGRLSALAVCAAYIDLNPVRAGLVSDPKDYRFCGYGEAEAGQVEARRGIGALMEVFLGNAAGSKRSLRTYRSILFAKGSAPSPGKGGRAAVIDAEKAAQVIAEGGQLPLHELLLLRVRYFSDGLVLGSKAFVDEILEENRERLRAGKGASAKSLVEAHGGALAVLRQLRKQVIGPARAG